MAHTHYSGRSHGKSLWLALMLTGSFFIVKVAGGIVTGSLALLSDAAHMFTDVTALVIALAAVRIGEHFCECAGRWPADRAADRGARAHDARRLAPARWRQVATRSRRERCTGAAAGRVAGEGPDALRHKAHQIDRYTQIAAYS